MSYFFCVFLFSTAKGQKYYEVEIICAIILFYALLFVSLPHYINNNCHMMNLKHYLLTILFILSITPCWAQSQLSVARFQLLENDLTANTRGTEKMDQNGERAALIKIPTPERGFTFDGGSLGIVATKQHAGEIWLYVPRRSQKLIIQHASFGVLRDFFYPIPIEGGRTYEMLLDVGTGRYVSILTEPAGASVTIDGQPHGQSPVYNQYLPYGQHTIEARNGFLMAEETITVSPQDRKEAYVKTLKLKERMLSETDYNNIKPASMNPLETIAQKSYYMKGMRVIRLNMNLTFPTPAPALEKFAALILFGDTVNTSLKKAAEAFIAPLGEAKKTSDKKITHWYTISMTPSDYREGYYYCYYLNAEFKIGNDNKGRQCLIIYDATTDRVLSTSDVFNPSTVEYINTNAGSTFKHMSITDGNLVLQYQKGNDYQTMYFSLNDKTKMKPYFLALMSKKAQKQQAENKNTDTNTSNEFVNEQFRFRITSGHEVEIINITSDRTEEAVIVPSSVRHNGTEYTVTAIGRSSMQMLGATTLTIPATIKSIGSMAFWGCKKLKTIKVDTGNADYCVIDNVLLTKDQKSLLLYPACRLSDNYTIPATVESIAEYAFENCKIKSIAIPATTTAIPTSTFYGCFNLSAITVNEGNPKYSAPDNVLMTKDGKTLLRYPAGKTDDVYTLPSSVEQIEWGAFSDCNLTSVVINSEKIKIAAYAFRDCRNLTNVQIPSKIVPELPKTVFSDCIRLENILLDGGAQSISAEAYKEGDRDKVYDTAEQMPSFPGGQTALFQWISKNIKYPIKAEENGIQGRVICAFIVERDGSIHDVQVVKPVDPLLDEEALRLVKSMPRWMPGLQNGKPIRAKYTVPVTFKMTTR